MRILFGHYPRSFFVFGFSFSKYNFMLNFWYLFIKLDFASEWVNPFKYNGGFVKAMKAWVEEG